MAEVTECTAADRDEFWQDTPRDVTGATETSEDQDRAGGQVMDQQIIERAVEAAARGAYERDVRSHQPMQPPFAELFDSEQAGWRDEVRPIVTAALAEVGSSLTAERDDLAARVARVEALHQPVKRTYYSDYHVTECLTCVGNAYPCPTIKALRGESE